MLNLGLNLDLPLKSFCKEIGQTLQARVGLISKLSIRMFLYVSPLIALHFTPWKACHLNDVLILVWQVLFYLKEGKQLLVVLCLVNFKHLLAVTQTCKCNSLLHGRVYFWFSGCFIETNKKHASIGKQKPKFLQNKGFLKFNQSASIAKIALFCNTQERQ